MPVKKISKADLAHQLFINLAPRWDIKDKEGARLLASACFEAAEGFAEVAAERGHELNTVKLPVRLAHAAAN